MLGSSFTCDIGNTVVSWGFALGGNANDWKRPQTVTFRVANTGMVTVADIPVQAENEHNDFLDQLSTRTAPS